MLIERKVIRRSAAPRWHTLWTNPAGAADRDVELQAPLPDPSKAKLEYKTSPRGRVHSILSPDGTATFTLAAEQAVEVRNPSAYPVTAELHDA